MNQEVKLDFPWFFRTYFIAFLFLWEEMEGNKTANSEAKRIRSSLLHTDKLPLTNRIIPLKSKCVFLNKQSMVTLFYVGKLNDFVCLCLIT